ncbi:MAG: DUF2922 domain-containing protein [Candidatus Atribacteria bacterium]|nr:DUF2922 domain-containing protein [Candidatus Atribacteria bacterium]MCD6349647.1 DUF2922 domain-containing protein [Candidatus Atribacteria bacterium]
MPNPKEDLQDAEVDALMDQVINDDLFNTSGGSLISKEEAYIEDTTVTQINLT